MTDYVQHGGIKIAKPLYDLVRAEIAPGTGVAPEAAWSLLDAIVQTLGPRNRALLAFLDQLAPGDMPDVVDRFRALGLTDARAGEYAMLLTAWAKADPLAAMAYAEEKTRGPFATRTLLAAWAANDPDAALRWADAHRRRGGGWHHPPVPSRDPGSAPCRHTVSRLELIDLSGYVIILSRSTRGVMDEKTGPGIDDVRGAGRADWRWVDGGPCRANTE